MGFSDRDYVREKAREAEAKINAQYSVNRNPWQEAEWSSTSGNGSGGSTFFKGLFKLAVLILSLWFVVWCFSSKGPFLGAIQGVISNMSDGLIASHEESRARLAKSQQMVSVTPLPRQISVNPIPQQRQAVLDPELIPVQPDFVPSMTGYTDMGRQVVMRGNTTFQIINSAGHAIFARMYSLSNGGDVLVREFYLRQGEAIPLNRLDDGMYLLRYQQLTRNGGYYASKPMWVGSDGKMIHAGVTLHTALDRVGGNRKISAAEFAR